MKVNESLKEVSLEIDLKKDLGGEVESASARRLIAEDLIQSIINRSTDGIGVTKSGSEYKLPKYSKDYIDSLEFKAYGKTPSEINLQLTGTMLDSIEVLESTPDKIKIGIVGEEAPKAYNHQTGDTVPKRSFIGATKEDLSKLKSEYSDEIGPKSAITVNDILDAQNFTNIFKELSRRGII